MAMRSLARQQLAVAVAADGADGAFRRSPLAATSEVRRSSPPGRPPRRPPTLDQLRHAAIPLESLEPALREKVRAVLSKTTLAALGATGDVQHPASRSTITCSPTHDQLGKLWRQLGARVSDITDQGRGHYLWQDGPGQRGTLARSA